MSGGAPSKPPSEPKHLEQIVREQQENVARLRGLVGSLQRITDAFYGAGPQDAEKNSSSTSSALDAMRLLTSQTSELISTAMSLVEQLDKIV